MSPARCLYFSPPFGHNLTLLVDLALLLNCDLYNLVWRVKKWSCNCNAQAYRVLNVRCRFRLGKRSSSVHFVYSANGEGEFCAVLAFDSCSSFNTAKPMEEITHFRHYLLNIAKHTFYLVLCSLSREGRTTNTMRRVVKILSHKSTSKAMTTDSRGNIKL
jgi:hypothetical protein